MLTLRPYQSESIAETYKYLRANAGKNPLICLPTGAGKSAVIAQISMDAVTKWDAKVVVLTHVKELLVQLQETLLRVWPEGADKIGIHSASIGPRDTDHPIILAGVQSVFRRAEQLGFVNVLLIDECHGIPVGADGEGMYLKTIAALKKINPNLRVIGLTATPFRTSTGTVCGPNNIFHEMCYDIGVSTLIDGGYLSPLRSKNFGSPDLSKVHKRAGEFKEEEVSVLMEDADLVEKTVTEVIKQGSIGRIGWMFFCSSVEHSRMVFECVKSKGISVALVLGETNPAERDEAIKSFKEKRIRCIVNNMVLTTGFDAPHVDLIAMLRPTLSPGLYCQILGRGLRKSPGKEDCMILDFAGNIQRHGPIDDLRQSMDRKSKGDGGEAPMMTCPDCQEIHSISNRICPACGHVYPPPPVAKHDVEASDLSPLGKNITVSVTHHKVSIHKKEGKPPSIRIDFFSGAKRYPHWLCVEHTGYARSKACKFFEEISPDIALPHNCQDAYDVVKSALYRAKISEIVVRSGGDFPKIMRIKLGATNY